MPSIDYDQVHPKRSYAVFYGAGHGKTRSSGDPGVKDLDLALWEEVAEHFLEIRRGR